MELSCDVLIVGGAAAASRPRSQRATWVIPSY